MGSIKMLTSVIIATSCFLVSSAQKTVCTEEALADIVFLVDGSWSIGTENYQKIRDFLLTLVNSFDVGPDKVRIGLVQYSNTARTEFYLNSYEDKQKILNYLATLPYMGGGTRTGLGLDFLLTEHFVEEAGSRAKEQVPQIAVVITDGQSQDDVESHAQQLKRRGIILYAIGIKDADMEQLKEIATMPHDKHIYSVSDFTALQGISQSFIQVLCTTVEEAKRQVSQVLQGCRANLADIVFLVDSSSSIGDENFLKVKQFLHKFIDGMDIRPDGIQVGVAQFSNDPYTEFLLGQYADKDELLEKVDNLVYRRGGTETGKALVFLRNNYFTGAGSSRASQNVPQIAVVITDGDSSDNMKKPAMELREKGVFIFTLGVGAANITELQSIANKPHHRFLVSFSNYQALLDGTTSMTERVCMSIEAQQQVPTPKFVDVFILVDSSAGQIQQIRQMLSRLANQLSVSRTSNRLAVAQFGRDVSLEFLFNAYRTRNEALTLIQKFQLKSTLPRNLGKAMDHVRTQFLNAASGSRIAQGYKQVLLVVSAGPSNDNALTAVRALKDDGVTVVNVDLDEETHLVYSSEQGTDYSARKTIIAPPQKTFTLVKSSVPQIVQNVRTVIEAEELPGVSGECKSAQVADIVFIVDGSDSVTLQNFKLLRTFLHRVIKGIEIGLDSVRVGMVLYGEIPRPEFYLNSFENKPDILQYIKVLPHLGGEGNITEALKLATTEVFTKSHGSRHHIGVQQIAVVITEGNFIDKSTIDEATNLRRSGVQVYALSVTQDNTKQLEKIASYPPRKFVFTVESFTKLKKIENILRTTLCVNVVGSTGAKARRYNIKQGCIKTEEADIYFLIDHSGSILDKDFQDMKKFILEFLLMFSIGPKMVRIGVVKFADAPTLEFSLIDHTDRSSVDKAVSSIEQKGGGTQTGKGLSYMIQRFKEAKETRGNKVQEILIVITDGKSQDSVKVPAQTLRDQGVNIYAIGVKDANWEELLEIAGSQTKTFLVTNFDALKPLKNEIATDICSEDACKTMRADVIFLLDGSWSIASEDFSKMKTFLNTMISKLKIEKDSVQVGVLQFSTQTKVEFALNRFYNKDQMKAAVMAMKQLNENTHTGGALHKVSNYFNGINGGRSDVPQILIIITDGEAQDDVAEPAKNLRDKGVTIYSIGVASANITQLREISGSPDKVYLERDFDALDYLDEDLLLKICSSDDCLKSQVADVVFLVDGSSSIAYKDFESMKFFMKSVVNSTQVGKNYVRFCTILYSDNPEVKFPLNKYYSKHEVRDAISAMKHFGGDTYTAKGLQYSQAYFRPENGGRGTKGVPQMLFIITDGEATDPYDLSKHSEELLKNGIDVYGVGVANATKKELLIMTKDENKVFHVKNFDALKALQRNISEELCKNSKPECNKKSADLVILIDGSESIEEDPWKIMMNFMLSLVDSLRIQPDLFRIGVAQFSYEYAKEFYLNEYTDGEQVKKAILSINQMKQGTRIGHGLNGVQEFFQASKGSRISEGIAQNLLLITDGKSSDEVYAVADSLRVKGIKMFVIGIGDISKQQLNYIAGSTGSVFFVDSFDQLKLNKTTQQVIDIICNEPIPQREGCTVDIGVGFDISHVQASSQPLMSGQYKLQLYFSEIIKYISTLYNLCCLTKPTLQTNVGYHVIAKDGTIIYETNFEAYDEKVVKKVIAVERTEALALNTQLLRSFQDKFKRSNAGVKIVIIFTDGPDASLQDLMLASENLRKSGVHALLTVALDGVQNTIDLQRLEFGRGFGYKDPLTIGMQSVSSAIQKQIDTVASRECCNVLCTCTGHEGVRGSRGPPGTKGLPGQRGHIGFPGEEGGIGDRGHPGLNGTQGHQGCPGKQGLKGGRGYRGDMGEDGEHGLDGVNGEQGKTGEAGARGERGDPGSPGQRGVRGTPGDSGSKGLRGDPGESGSDSIIRGPKGEIGNSGLLGDMGPDGTPGSRGEPGKPGQAGRRGARGIPGIRGPPGEPGLQGIPGPSGPLSYANFNGDRGLKGMPGLKGPQGLSGPQGGIGPKGNIGPRGPKGQPGDSGEKGPAGPMGTRGLPGTDGQDGYGTPGPKGQKGDSGFPGYPGYQGESGTSGTKGANGHKGNRGKRGSAGRSGPPGEPGTVGYAGHRGPKGPPGAKAMSTCQLVNYVRDNCVCCKANAACPAYPTELVFGLDMSEGVNPTLFERMRSALLSFLENINMAESNCPTGARVAVVAYSSNVKYLIRFGDYQRKTQLVEAVKNIALERTTNRRNIGVAMRFVGRNVFKRVRQSALMRKVAIFFAVAPSQDLTSINTAVLEYKAANINLGVIAYRNVQNVRRAFEADETGSFILSVIERPRDESAALQRIQQCVICFDFCNPARGCPSVIDMSVPKEVDVDLAMLVDSSRNIQADQYEGIKQVLGSVLDQIAVSSQPNTADKQARVALYQQSSSYSEAQAPVKEVFTFQQYQDRNQMKQSMFRNLQQTGGSSKLSQAIEYTTINRLLNTPKSRKNKMMIVIVGDETDYHDSANLDLISTRAQCLGVMLFILTVGDRFNCTQVEELASFPNEQHIIHLNHVKLDEQEYARRFMRTFFHFLNRQMNTYPAQSLRTKCASLQQQGQANVGIFETAERAPIDRIPLPTVTYTEEEEEVEGDDTIYRKETGTQIWVDFENGGQQTTELSGLNAQCLLDMDTGTVCGDYVQRWYYDRAIDACSPFWYGGCGGNSNRFSTGIECSETCVMHRLVERPKLEEVSSVYEDTCLLKQDQGTCQNFELKWYYDTVQNECSRFWFGGCGGNSNRFDTQEECEARCVRLHTASSS